jgi:integrase
MLSLAATDWELREDNPCISAPPAVAILDAIEERDGYVIRGLDPSKPLPVSTAEKAWQRLRERAGIPDARLHDLRHTAGTFAALAGANAFAVRDLLGHHTLAMTGRYVERAADLVRATADAVSSRVAAALNARHCGATRNHQLHQTAVEFPRRG